MPISGGELLGSLNASQHQDMLYNMVNARTNGSAAEALSGGAMSRGMAIGAPIGMLGLGLMGLDPMSMGLRAGMSAWGGGAGLAGSIGAASMAAAPMALGLAGMGFAGNQMMVGANQQRGLSGALSQFNFQNNQGGMGFTSGQSFQVGNQLRTMTHEFGPQGEVQTFGELSRLASNMGRMGLAQNVRSVQEFKEKFKEMVSTLKTVAHDMGSSLEEAQKFITSMKGSGIFSKSDQLKASAGTRVGALAGGLAQSEITGMGSIGSQISRSVGGLGRAGTFAGMAAITNVGIAQRVGALSEEDIYNATGLTGADGRQAFAASQLQGSAGFLRSGRGRKFLASITAGTGNGELDEGAISEWMSGGMSTQRTMQLAHQNLKGTGRADFMRNEGRLRGAALQRLNELGVDPQTLAYSQWLTSKGFSPENMDDRAMLAFQRFSGKGRDEADAAIKQIRALPEIMAEARNTTATMQYNDNLTKKLNTTGLKGLERKMEHIKEGISGKFQKVGADILQAGQESIESWFNSFLGVYEQQASDSVAKADAALRRGDKNAYQQSFGMASKIGASSFGFLSAVGLGGSKDIRTANARLQVAMSDQNKISQFTGSAMRGNMPKELEEFAAKHQMEIREASLSNGGGGYAGSIKSFDKLMREHGQSQGGSLSPETQLAYYAASREDKIGMIAGAQRAAGISSDDAFSMVSRLKADKRGQGFLGGGGNRTVAEREKALGGYFSGGETGGEFSLSRSLMGNLAVVGVGAYSRNAGGTLEQEEARGMARFALGRGAVSMGTLTNLYAGDADQKAEARRSLQETAAKLRQADGKPIDFAEMNESDRGQLRMAAGMFVTTDPANSEMMDKLRAGGSLRDSEYRKLESSYSAMTGGGRASGPAYERFKREIAAVARDGSSGAALQAWEDQKKQVGIISGRNSYERTRAVNVGMATVGADGALQLSKDAGAGLSKEALAVANMALHAATMTVTEGESLGTYYREQGMVPEGMAGLSGKDKQELAKRGGVVGEQAGQQLTMEKRWAAGAKGSYSHPSDGEAGSLAGVLGLSLGRKDMKTLKGMSQQEMVHSLLDKSGLGGDGGKIEQDLMKAMAEKNEGLKALKVNQVLGSQDVREKLESNRNKAAENADPTYKLLSQHVPEQTKYLKLIVNSNEKSAAALAQMEHGDPEKTEANMSGG